MSGKKKNGRKKSDVVAAVGYECLYALNYRNVVGVYDRVNNC